jgi:hypothetical protein
MNIYIQVYSRDSEKSISKESLKGLKVRRDNPSSGKRRAKARRKKTEKYVYLLSLATQAKYDALMIEHERSQLDFLLPFLGVPDAGKRIQEPKIHERIMRRKANL